MFKPVGILFLAALIFLAGCATTPTMPEEPITSPPPLTSATNLNWADPNLASPHQPPFSKAKPSAAKMKRPPAQFPKAAAKPTTTWLALNDWAVQQQLGAPRLLSSTPVISYSVGSGQGTLALTVGSRVAMWNGVELHLGFAPQMIGGQIFLHGLDLEKNLAPLLCAPPLSFATNRVIVIDPGHGGSNFGTRSVLDGRFEKEFTLDWAHRLAPLLATNGWQVFLTRTNEGDSALSNRVLFAEVQRAGLFISLHFNSAAPSTEQAGLETYTLTPAGMPSNLTRGYDDTWAQSFPGNAFDLQNVQLAMRLHTALLRATGEEDRGVRRARFLGVLRGQKCPAVLVEAGYLSNPREAKRIADPEFRQQLAEVIADALR